MGATHVETLVEVVRNGLERTGFCDDQGVHQIGQRALCVRQHTRAALTAAQAAQQTGIRLTLLPQALCRRQIAVHTHAGQFLLQGVGNQVQTQLIGRVVEHPIGQAARPAGARHRADLQGACAQVLQACVPETCGYRAVPLAGRRRANGQSPGY